ncbi:MAG: polysaccharide biosynthesis tyrosine autokinase, partial [Saprospiraceae bacterium]
KGNVLELGLEDEVPSRANALLDSLITYYNKLGIEESNQVALNTIDFIDERLQYISGELTDVEGGLQSFKEKNKTLGLSNEGELLLENLSAYDKEVATLEIQKEILKNIQKYLSDDQKAFDYVPTNLGLTNLTLVGLLEQFNMLLSQRLRLSSTAGESNPRWLEINAQIESIRSKIIQNINSIQQDFNVALQKTQNKARELQSRVRAAPKMERQFLEIRRQQNIKESLYLFLLQKREEAALSLAMTVPNAQIIDPANNTVKPIRPMKFNIFLIAMAIGLIVSSIIIYLRETLNTKIEDENDLTSLTSVPLLGRISKNSQKTSIVVTKESRTIIAESFKALRTNLNFIKNDNPSTVISITSTISGEGKSFISINLALAYAALDKKVALVGMDLRKPKLTDYLEESNPLEGVSTYLAGRSNFESILFKTNIGENITLVPSGPIPPNPNELLQNDRLKVLIDELRSRFDYIIIDTSPVGLVSDAIIISEFADQTLYIIRKSYTEKGALKLLNELYISHKVKGLGIVLNGITSNNRYGSYSYSNQKYYTYYDSEERGLMAKVKSFLRIK